MAPYLGLTCNGREISAPGYARKDLSDVVFYISPSNEPRTIVVLNRDKIVWAAPLRSPSGCYGLWADVTGMALFDDVIGDLTLTASSLSSRRPMAYGDHLDINPGALTFLHRFTDDRPASHPFAAQPPGSRSDEAIKDLLRALRLIAKAPAGTTAREMRRMALNAISVHHEG